MERLRRHGLRQPSRHVATSPTVNGKSHGTPRQILRHMTRQNLAAMTERQGPRCKTRGTTRGKARWEQSARWVSGGSCGGLVTCPHLVSGSRLPNGMGPLRGATACPKVKQSASVKYILDHASDTPPTRQHELDHTTPRCSRPERSRS